MDDTKARVEEVERAAFLDLSEAAKDVPGLGLDYHMSGKALIMCATGDHHFLINRVIGLGVQKPARRDAVALFVELFKTHAIKRYFVHLTDNAQPTEVRGWLEEEGLVPQRRWMKFVHGGGQVPDARSDLEVRQVGPEHGEDFGRIVAAAFDFEPVSIPALATLCGRPNWRIFMGFKDGQPGATGALFFDQGVGWCDFGATHPDFRRMGGQRAMLKARIEAARELGCDLIATETGEEVPGDPQHSYHNILWAGFEESYLRDNYAPG